MNNKTSSCIPIEHATSIQTKSHQVTQITTVSRYLDASMPSVIVDTISVHNQEPTTSASTAPVTESVGVIEDDEITAYECTSEANQYPHTCFTYTSKNSLQEIQNLTEEAKLQGIISERTAIIELMYKTVDTRTIYFTAGIPDSGACCSLLSFNKDTLKFHRVESYGGLGMSFSSKDNRYIATVENNNSIYILDLEQEKIIKRAQVPDSLMSSKCGYGGPVYDLKYNENKNGFDYGVYGPNTVPTDECKQEKISVGFLPIE